ncbi:MAG: HAMP domain-containing histidine kinase [Chloroflexi bacterium]|nr:HAMP domain-containing histidine kinase [Chloroflexota bacterium]
MFSHVLRHRVFSRVIRRLLRNWRPLEPIVLLTLIFAVILIIVGTVSLIMRDADEIVIAIDFIVGGLLLLMGRWMIRSPQAITPRVIVVALITIGSFIGIAFSPFPAARSAGMILPVLFAVVASGRIYPIIFYPLVVVIGMSLNISPSQNLSENVNPYQYTGFEFGFALLLFLVMWSIREHAAWQGAQRADAAAKLQQEQILTTFMRFIAHELRGTASVLSALAPTLETRLTAPPQTLTQIDGQAAYTAYADTTKRINDLLQRLLIITRTGVLSSEQIQPVALAPLLLDAANEIRALDVPVEITLDMPPDLEVVADPAYLSMACTTALRNAAEAMQLTEHPVITIRVFQSEHDTTIRIEDSGPGFPPHLLTQLQSVGTESALPVGMFTTKVSGTGLGLPLMDRVARLHNGYFSYGNLPKGGAWIQMVLPNKPAEPALDHTLRNEPNIATITT